MSTAARFTTLTSHAALLLANDVDTDQIVPARFLKVTDKAGLGEALFVDFKQGYKDGFPLERPEAKGAQVLVVGKNFGCGSSREHAPWALCAAGFRAVVAPSFADIFRGNALKNGLLPVALAEGDHAALVAAITADPRTPLTIDLESQTIGFAGRSAQFAVDAFARRCLLDGVDELGYLRSHLSKIEAHERAAESRQ
ncbi:MAG: 3-isopropylmalate dehydratase small subunit [Deltaproteobacteria bacterium]|nr:3-isopropylmalate dehydratase small subunit [Kofleriaceae bacterium]